MRPTERLRLALGGGAALSAAVIGCSSVVGGEATVDTEVAADYRTSVSVALSSSAAEEAEREAAAVAEAVHTACETFRNSGVDAIDDLNIHADDLNAGGDGIDTGMQAAESLNRTANLVFSDLTEVLPTKLHDVLNAWVETARAMARAIQGLVSTDEYNAAIDELNATKDTALQQCRNYS